MESPAPTAETFDRWIRTHEALTVLAKAFGSEYLAQKAVFDRVLSDVLHLYARSVVRTEAGKIAAQKNEFARVRSQHCGEIDIDDLVFWGIGNLTFETGGGYSMNPAVAFRYLEVRLDPKGYEELLATAPHKVAAEPQVPVNAPDQLRGSPVSPAHLRAWFDVYKQTYIGAADTEDMALKSATGMFPDKHVSRDKIRELRGPQRRGRKPGEAE